MNLILSAADRGRICSVPLWVLLAFDDRDEISVHHFGPGVHILELFTGFQKDDRGDVDDIFVVEEFQESQFLESSFCKDFVLKGFVDLFYRHQLILLKLFIFGNINDSICSLSFCISRNILLVSMIS